MDMNVLKNLGLKSILRGAGGGVLFATVLSAAPVFAAGSLPGATSGDNAFAVMQTDKRTVTGIVRDSKGEALIGVSVVLKGTTTGTITGLDGDYSIEVPASGRSS